MNRIRPRRSVGNLGVCFFFALSIVCAGTIGCNPFDGATIHVEMSSAGGIKEDAGVYFAGVQVGETGEPSIVQGKAIVPVHLFRAHTKALAADTVFGVGADPTNAANLALIGHSVGMPQRKTVDGIEVYPGVASEMELSLLIGVQKAREWWDFLSKAAQ